MKTKNTILLLVLLEILNNYGSFVQGAANITEMPVNTTILSGYNTTFQCTVTGQQLLDESFFWYKLPHPDVVGPNDLIAHNALCRDDSKYIVVDKYDLVILDVEVADEGVYECTLNNFAYQAALNVVVLPSTFKVYARNNGTLPTPGNTISLLCYATDSRPLPTLRWYKGPNEITGDAKTQCTEVDKDGFGSCSSVIDIKITKFDYLASVLCVADLPSYPGASIYEYSFNTGVSSFATNWLILLGLVTITFWKHSIE